MRNALRWPLFFLLFLKVSMAWAGQEPVESPQPSAEGRKVQVVDVFWYGCSHCWEFLPLLEAFRRDYADEVVVQRVPALVRQHWEMHARLFYALEALDVEQDLHVKIFERIHEMGDDLGTYQKIRGFVVSEGVDRAAFSKVFNSVEVDRHLEQARELQTALGVSGTPTVIIDGAYLIDGNTAGTLPGIIEEMKRIMSGPEAKL